MSIGRERPSGTAALCLSAVTHSYLLFSRLPYAAFFAIFLLKDSHHDITVTNVGFFAGMLGTAFTLGRFFAFFPWRAIRAKIGERGALLTSLLLCAISSLLFGLSQSFAWALIAGFLSGISNCISGTVKRAAIDRARSRTSLAKVGDIYRDDEEVEEWAAARILFVLGWGCAIGPAVGGWVSDPSISQYLPAAYPFLLPNLVGAILCVFSALAVFFTVRKDIKGGHKESENEKENPLRLQVAASSMPEISEEQPLVAQKPMAERQENDRLTFWRLWKTESTRFHLIAYWSFSFCVVSIEECLPLFLISLGLTAPQVGWILAASGGIAILFQHASLGKALMDNVGLYSALRLTSILGTIPSFLFPISIVLNGGRVHDAADSTLILDPRVGVDVTCAAFAFLVIIFALLRVSATQYFGYIGIATGRTIPHDYKDDASRIMTVGALAVRSLAPIVSGGLYSVLCRHPWTVWGIIGTVFGFVASIFTFSLKESATDGLRAADQSEILQRRSTYLYQRQSDIIFSNLWERHFYEDSNSVAAKWRRLARKVIIINRFSGEAVSQKATAKESYHSEIKKKRISWVDRTLRSGIDVDEVPFFIIGTHKGDTPCEPHVMSPPLLDALHQHLPAAVCDCNFWLKYSLIRDGASLTSLESMIGFSKYTVLAIETLSGSVFGSFTTKPWQRSKDYKDGGESFLWRMKRARSFNSLLSRDDLAAQEGDIEVFKWTGANDFCQLFTKNKIAVGGGGEGFAFVLDEDLAYGRSSSCSTYNNPCMVDDAEGKFAVANIEVWALTPFLFQEDAERSERSQKFAENNLATPSSQSPWTQFL